MRRFAGLDGAFLAFESPAAPLHIVGAMVFDPSDVPGGVGFEDVRALVARRLPRVPPFRQRAVAVPFGIDHGGLVDDPSFDLDYHVRRSALPRPGGRAELAAAVADIAERPLDRTRPLWEFHVVEGVEGGRFALVTKVHHAIIDGVSGAELLAAFFDLTPHPGPQPVDPETWSPPPVPGELGMVRDALGELPARIEGIVRATAGTVRLARRLSGRNREVGGTLPPSPFDAPRTSINGTVSAHRRVALAQVPMASVDEVRSRLGGSVNDVVLVLVAGGLRRLFAARGEAPDGSLVAMVPVSVRQEDERGMLGNRVAAMLVSTASGVADHAARLRLVSEDMAKAKEQHAVVGAEPFATWADALAPAVATRLARLATNLRVFDRLPPPFNLVVSNVPGPREDLYLAGARLESLHPFGPIVDGVGVNVTVFSYGRTLFVGVTGCRDLAGDVDVLAAGVERTAAELVAHVRRADRPIPWWNAGPSSGLPGVEDVDDATGDGDLADGDLADAELPPWLTARLARRRAHVTGESRAVPGAR